MSSSASRRVRRHLVRPAAFLAIAAAILFAATLIGLVVRQPGALLLALALVVVAGTGAWLALTRRGLSRIAGVVCVTGAVAGEAVALVVFGLLDELVLLLVSGAVFSSAGRAAVRSSLREQRPAPSLSSPRRTPHTGSSRRKVLIMNPKSGGGKVARFGLVEEARRRGIEPVLLERGDDLRALAREAAASAEVIGMAGGDGSQALVAHVAMEADIAFVCVPAGTRNHLALDLGLDREDVV